MNLFRLSEKTTIILIFSANIALRLFRLNSPNFPYYDERVFYLPAAREILAGKLDPNNVHPPLAKELLALMLHFFGDNVWAARSLQAVLASLAIVAIYLIAKKLFKNQKLALIAAFLISIDFGWFILSRLAIPEMFMISFFFFSLYFLVCFYQKKVNRDLIFGAVFFGLALCCKWTPLLFVPIAIATLFWKFKASLNFKLKIIAISSIVALISYLVPFFLMPAKYTLTDIVSFHAKALHYNFVEEKQIVQTQLSLANQPLIWPIKLQPLHAQESGKDSLSGVIFLFNPAVLWGSLAATFLTLKKFWKKKRLTKEVFLAAGFLIFWLPWFFSPRHSFVYYWAIGLPFGAMLLAKFYVEMEKKYRWEVLGFLIMTAVLFGFYYPILTNLPVKVWYFRILTGYFRILTGSIGF